MSLALTVNAGSSSLKTALFDRQSGQRLSDNTYRFDASGLHWCSNGQASQTLPCPDLQRDRFQAEALAHLVAHLQQQGIEVSWVGHRIVHGGARYWQPQAVTNQLIAQLQQLVHLAPLHQPAGIAALQACRQAYPQAAQLACFDTAFHQQIPQLNHRFAIDEQRYRQGIRRYGFHGLAYESMLHQLQQIDPQLAQGKLVLCQLGSGASVCAVAAGKSRHTSMGFSATDGLPMSTRSGSIDPGVLLYLLQQEGLQAQQLEDELNNRSGLLGLSGSSGDLRELLQANGQGNNQLAIDYFVARAAEWISVMVTSLGGLDGLVFSGGVGEHLAGIRSAIVERLKWMGLSLDESANTKHAQWLCSEQSRAKILLIPANEEERIFHHLLAMQAH